MSKAIKESFQLFGSLFLFKKETKERKKISYLKAMPFLIKSPSEKIFLLRKIKSNSCLY